MCGILIYQDTDVNRHKSFYDSDLFRSPIFKRGPDSQAVHIISHQNSRILTVNSILSIKSNPGEVSPCLRKIFSATGDASVFLYNGESYEVTWKDKLDTEEFYHHSERGATYIYDKIPLYRGFFSHAAIIDKRILFSVDLLSEKSLFWYSDGSVFILASTISSVLHVLRSIGLSPDLNRQVCRDYFHTRHFIQYPSTVWSGIRRVLPGTVCTHDINSLITTVPSIEQSSIKIYQTMKSQFTPDPLDTITKRYLSDSLYDSSKIDRSAFVISGGIDSTLVSLESNARHSSSAHSFWTLIFGSKDNAALKTSALASSAGINHHSIHVTPELYKDALSMLSHELCYPLPTHSFASFYILAANVASSGAKILYGGEGADEVYQGYSLYQSIRFSPKPEFTSISPYSSYSSRFPGFPAEPLTIQPDVNIGFQTFYKLFLDDGYTFPVERASLLCDLTFQLASTGLLCVDDIGGMFGMESRSPLANVFAASRILFDYSYDFFSNVGDGKKMLRSMLAQFDNARCIADLPKQGFSGYPNEIFDNKQSSLNYDFISDYLGLKSDFSSLGSIDSDLKWKINNLSTFLRSQM